MGEGSRIRATSADPFISPSVTWGKTIKQYVGWGAAAPSWRSCALRFSISNG